jgi:hypothetical protein
MDGPAGKEGQDGKPDEKGTPEFSEKRFADRSKSRVSLALLLVAISVLLTAWAGLFGNLGHTFRILAAFVLMAASVCLILGLRFQLRNHHWKKSQYDGATFVCLVLSAGLMLAVIVHEIVPGGPVPLIPWIEITSQEGLSLSPDGGEITMEMQRRYREHRLIIRNRNTVDLRNFSASVQLPEPAAISPPSSILLAPIAPPLVHIVWQPHWPETSALDASRLIGKIESKAEWDLEIDTLPALKSIEISFLTVPQDGDRRPPLGLTDTNSRVLINYLFGDYQFGGPESWKTQVVVMAILFDATNRAIRTLPPENTRTNWKQVRMRESFP